MYLPIFFVLFYNVAMDDKEYYSMMNRSNSALIIQQLQKKTAQKKNPSKIQNTSAEKLNLTELRQGREDTEMLHEKKGDFKNEE